MSTIAQKIKTRVVDIQEFTITEEKMHSIVKRRNNWSAPGIDGMQNYWWKKLKGTWKFLLNCFNRWVEQPDEIPQWLAQERTVLLPKTEELGNEKLLPNHMFEYLLQNIHWNDWKLHARTCCEK